MPDALILLEQSPADPVRVAKGMTMLEVRNYGAARMYFLRAPLAPSDPSG